MTQRCDNEMWDGSKHQGLDTRETALLEREGTLRSGEEALRLREESIAGREAAADAEREFVRAQSEQLKAQLLQIREANEQLVLAALRSQALTEAAEAAEQAVVRKDDFLAMLSHELRNPLAPIRNAVGMLDLISSAEPRLPRIRDLIERQVHHMSRLLDDLLDVARVRSGKLVLQRSPVAVQDVISQAVDSCRALARARDQQLTVELPTEPLYLDGDPVRLVQVFGNLLNNAIKYTPEGGWTAVRVHARDGALVVRVQDNGNGISGEALTHIFELFTQEDRLLDRAQGGLGIGLTVVRRLVELHGGTVEANSAGAGRGSEFVVTLPMLQVPSDQAAGDRKSPTATSPHRLRIAVIEDNVDANDSLSALLQMVGHEVIAAYDGVSGLELVRARRPEVVLCDVGLPGMDGLTLAARLREEMPDELPVMIALTGYGQAEDRQRALAAGFASHITKPVDPQALLALIDQQAERGRVA